MSRVGIFGTGAYGISLAILSNRNKHDVIMWTKFPNERDYILTNHENTVLPGIKIDPSIKVTSDLKEFTDNSDIIIVALPVPFLKDCFKELANYLGIGRTTIYNLIKKKKIPASKIGKQYRFSKDVVDSWLKDKIITKKNI